MEKEFKLMLDHTLEKKLESNITKNNICRYNEFMNIIQDLVEHPTVKQMRNFNQHANTSCYQHCM